MRTRLLPVHAIEPADERRWRLLAEESLDPNPFFEPEFILPAARHLGGAGGQLLLMEEGDRWLACLPVTPRSTRLKVPVLSGWRSPYSFLGAPLVAEGAERALPDLLLEGMSGRLTGAAMLDQVPADSRAWAALEDAIGAGELVQLARRDFDRAAYDPARSGPELELSSRRRADLRRTRRRLEEEIGAEVSFELVEPDEATLAEFVRLESAGWKGEEGTAVREGEGHARSSVRWRARSPRASGSRCG